MSKLITRRTVNEQQYAADTFSKSGFQLSHRRYSSYILGRLHISGYQNIMPSDKISGNNHGEFTFKRMVTPMVAPVDVAQYNLFIPFRALDRTFERAFAPSKDNGMSASWSAPTVNTAQLVALLFSMYYGSDTSYIEDLIVYAYADPANLDKTLNDFYTAGSYTDPFSTVFYGTAYGIIGVPLNELKTGINNTMRDYAKEMYLDDVCDDIAANLEFKLGSFDNQTISSTMRIGDFLYILLDCLLTPFVGRYSYYGELHYKYLRPFDLYRLTHVNFSTQIPIPNLNLFYAMFDDTPLSEYPLRAMYAIWYERFRNVDLEPSSPNLPYWRDFGSTSEVLTQHGVFMLCYRPRPWYEDAFTTAQIDDLSRHVWAPIVSNNSIPSSAYHVFEQNNLDTNNSQTTDPGFEANAGSQKPAVYILSWFDQTTNQSREVSCPVPTNINDILSASDLSFTDVYGLDLNTLRQSQQLERYLKRNYLFGDEYQDRMMAHYQSRVSDMRINRPEIISMSLNQSDSKQEIANMSNGISSAGDRVVTATISSSGDDYTFFSEEFGILIHLLSFMPLACYDGIQPQLLSTKFVDYPIPEFATNNEEFGRKCEIADSALHSTLIGTDDSDNRFMFGRYPAYHAWRQRVDEVGGDFLDELQDCTFRRFWGMYSDNTTPKLNYHFLHCHPNLGMFANTNPYDAQIYGDVIHECFVERVLPTPVEHI